MIEENTKKEILKHAQSDSENEICGIVIIFKGKERYVPCRNIADDSESYFVISPEDYANAEELGDIVKIIHSHPHANAEPSQADLIGIEKSGLPWIICNPQTEQFTETEPSGYKAPYVGRKFVPGIVDCYTIIQDYYKDELGITLPDFEREDYWWDKDKNLYADNFEKVGFTKVDISDIQPNDCFLICSGSDKPNHAAVYLGDGKMLHHLQGRLSSIDVFGGYYLKHLWACVRHVDFVK